MALRNSHGLRLPEAFPAPPFPCNQMGHCVAPLTTHCIPRSDDLSAMAPRGSCMLLTSAIAVPGLLPCAVSRKQHHAQTPTSACGVVAPRSFPLGFLASL